MTVTPTWLCDIQKMRDDKSGGTLPEIGEGSSGAIWHAPGGWVHRLCTKNRGILRKKHGPIMFLPCVYTANSVVQTSIFLFFHLNACLSVNLYIYFSVLYYYSFFFWLFCCNKWIFPGVRSINSYYLISSHLKTKTVFNSIYQPLESILITAFCGGKPIVLFCLNISHERIH